MAAILSKFTSYFVSDFLNLNLILCYNRINYYTRIIRNFASAPLPLSPSLSLSIYICVCVCVCVCLLLSIISDSYLSIHLSYSFHIYHLHTSYLSILLFISIYLSIYQSILVHIYVSIYLSNS